MMNETIEHEAVDDILSEIFCKIKKVEVWARTTLQTKTWIEPTADRDDNHLHVELLYRKSKV